MSARHGRRQRLQVPHLPLQCFGWLLPGGAVDARIGHFAQPVGDFHIGRHDVELLAAVRQPFAGSWASPTKVTGERDMIAHVDVALRQRTWPNELCRHSHGRPCSDACRGHDVRVSVSVAVRWDHRYLTGARQVDVAAVQQHRIVVMRCAPKAVRLKFPRKLLRGRLRKDLRFVIGQSQFND
jgi:hypothetical protein